MLDLLLDAWLQRFTKEGAKRAKSNHTVKMMLDKGHHKRVLNWTKLKVSRHFKRQSLQNALHTTVSGDGEKAAIWCLDEHEVGGQTISLQAILALRSCNNVLGWVGEEVIKEYKKLAQSRRLQVGNRSVRQAGARSDGEAVMDPAGAEGGKGLDEDDDKDEPAETALCAFMARNLHKGSTSGGCKPLQQGWKQRETKKPRRVGNLPLSFGEFIRAHPQGFFVFYGRVSPFQHARSTMHTRRRTRMRTGPRSVRQPTSGRPRWKCSRRSRGPNLQRRLRRSRDKKGKGRWKKGDAVNELPWRRTARPRTRLSGVPAAKGPG